MLIDAVLARDEFELVSLRVKYLEGQVDRIVIGESPVTFSGEPKPLHFSLMREQGLLPSWVDIVLLEPSQELIETGSNKDIQDSVRWEFLEQVIARYPNSRFLFQDVDEFPSREQIKAARTLNSRQPVVSIPMQIFYRKLNWKVARKGDTWRCAKLILNKPAKCNIRSLYSKEELPGEIGAHFSFLDTTSTKLEAKLRHYADQNANTPAILASRYLSFCDDFGLDHLGRANDRGFGLLNYIEPSSFTSTMRFAAAFSPQWVGSAFPHSLPARLVAAQVATTFKSSNGQTDFIGPRGDSITTQGWVIGPLLVATALSKHLVKRLRRKFIRVIRGILRQINVG